MAGRSRARRPSQRRSLVALRVLVGDQQQDFERVRQAEAGSSAAAASTSGRRPISRARRKRWCGAPLIDTNGIARSAVSGLGAPELSPGRRAGVRGRLVVPGAHRGAQVTGAREVADDDARRGEAVAPGGSGSSQATSVVSPRGATTHRRRADGRRARRPATSRARGPRPSPPPPAPRGRPRPRRTPWPAAPGVVAARVGLQRIQAAGRPQQVAERRAQRLQALAPFGRERQQAGADRPAEPLLPGTRVEGAAERPHVDRDRADALRAVEQHGHAVRCGEVVVITPAHPAHVGEQATSRVLGPTAPASSRRGAVRTVTSVRWQSVASGPSSPGARRAR